MSPDTPPVPKKPLPVPLKDSKTPFSSKVRTLLGLSNSVAVPLVSAASLPRIDLPYVNAQTSVSTYAPESWGDDQWVESALDNLDHQDWTGAEPSFPDSSPQLPPHNLSELPPSARQNDWDSQPSYSQLLGSSQEEGTGQVTDIPAPNTKRVQESLETISTELENPLSDLRTTPQKISISIPGVTQARASSSFPSSLNTDSSRVESRNRAEQPTMPYRQTTASSSESSSAALAGGLTAEAHINLSQSSDRVVETDIGVKPEGEPLDSASSPPVNEEEPTSNSVARLSAGNQTPQFPSLQRQMTPNAAAPGPNHFATTGYSTAHTNASEQQLNDLAAISAQRINFGVTHRDSTEAITTTEIRPTLDFNANPSKVHPMVQAPDAHRQTALNLTNSQPLVNSSQPAVNNRPPVESVSPVLSPEIARTSEPMAKALIASLAEPIPDTWQGREVAGSRYQAVHSMVSQIEKLERTVADLSSQVAAQKDFQQSVVPTFPQISEPKVIIQRPAAQPVASHAFWERSYVSRLYRWSRR
ncbi:hypothetical protein H6F61_27275 [Cyanobacteria bacterium FACHB-472]|nr:hypothetical protein [Cyanobacteria bacterium FACHB-472]